MNYQHNNCINCGIATWRCNTIGTRALGNDKILSIIQQWVAPQMVNSSHHICLACWKLASDSLSLGQQNSPSTRGHRQTCIHCGRSVLHKRSHVLHSNTERESRIRNIICQWILPRRTSSDRTLICHNCWVKADRVTIHRKSNLSGFVTSGDEQTPNTTTVSVTSNSITVGIGNAIVLPGYLRAAETEAHCFIAGCQRRERNRVSLDTRRMLLNTFNFYVPHKNRLCNHHLNKQSCDFLGEFLNDYTNVFMARHIEDMLKLKEYLNTVPNI